MIRENRYSVLKTSDVTEALDTDETELLIMLEEKIAAYREKVGKKPLECVVVESDWPEYEYVWQMLEKRVDQEISDDALMQGIEEYAKKIKWHDR